ncbi:hypothetical protein OIU84_000990 [Salix udensis]|uniref:Uncharacterized protein n=1 Tax=Salix udensis TaxID=889485 RepID=A0AAD6L7J5_9ROSI|nr:hypothetical protein OIU84_000990 [Salix udensis]
MAPSYQDDRKQRASLTRLSSYSVIRRTKAMKGYIEESKDSKTVHPEEHKQNFSIDDNPYEVSINLLAYFNKPELPFLLFGSCYTRYGHPISGLLLYRKPLGCNINLQKRSKRDSKFRAIVFVVLGFINFEDLPLRSLLLSNCRG